jgi:phage major head subunit gpT-like protein
MPITRNDLSTMYTAVTAAFLRGLQGRTPTLYEQFTTRMPMGTKTIEAPIAGTVGPLREWRGARIVQTIMRDAYRFTARKYEKTIAINRDDLEDDNVGVYMPAIEMLGVQTRLWPDQQVHKMLETNPKTYDGQPLFSASHPLPSGATASNYQAGGNDAWYLFDVSKPLKPMIWGERTAPDIVPRQDPADPHVFQFDEFLWGVRARGVAAPGFWQAAFKSKAALDSPNFEAAVTMMRTRADEQGENLGIEPTLLVVPPSREWDARRLFGRAVLNTGEENIHEGGIRWIVSNRLTGV